jgi:hypothetical protein
MWWVCGNQVREKKLKVTDHLNILGCKSAETITGSEEKLGVSVWTGLRCRRVRFSKRGSAKQKVRLRFSLRRQLMTNWLSTCWTKSLSRECFRLSACLSSFLRSLRKLKQVFFSVNVQFVSDTGIIYLGQFFTSLFCLLLFLESVCNVVFQ